MCLYSKITHYLLFLKLHTRCCRNDRFINSFDNTVVHNYSYSLCEFTNYQQIIYL